MAQTPTGRDSGRTLRRIWLIMERAAMSTRQRWLHRAGMVWRPVRARRRATQALAQFGESVAAAYGVPLAVQRRRLIAADLGQWLPANEFYLSRLQLDDRFAGAEEFLSQHQSFVLQARLLDVLQAEGRDLGDDKCRFADHCRVHGLAAVQPLWSIRDRRERVWQEILPASLPPGDLFAKRAINGLSGRGAFRIPEVAPGQYRCPDRVDRDWNGLLAFLREMAAGDAWLLQPAIRNHPDLLRLTNGALSTLRLVTAWTPEAGGEVILAAARFPAGNSVVDNFQSGGLVVDVDRSAGRLASPGYVRAPQLGVRVVDRHPDSGMRLEGAGIPLWSGAEDLALRAHASCPGLPFIGWDIAVTDREPVLVEANVRWGTNVVQAAARCGLGASRFGELYPAACRRSAAALQARFPELVLDP